MTDLPPDDLTGISRDYCLDRVKAHKRWRAIHMWLTLFSLVTIVLMPYFAWKANQHQKAADAWAEAAAEIAGRKAVMEARGV